STTPIRRPCSRTATAAFAYGRPSSARSGGSGAARPTSTSASQTGPAASAIVSEPQGSLRCCAQLPVHVQEGNDRCDVLRIVVRAPAHRLLEAGEPTGGAGFAHVVALTTALAGVFDRVPVEQVVGACRARDLDVHHAARVVSI